MNFSDKLIIPKYISSFELEEARLGQAIQGTKIELNLINEILEDHELLKRALLKIKNESVNAEYALLAAAEEIIEQLESVKDFKSAERARGIQDITTHLLYRLLQKKI